MATDDPTTVAVISVIGGLTTAAGTIIAGQAQAKALQYQSQVAANNAVAFQQARIAAIEAGQQAATNKSLQEAEEGGKIKAAEAASGVEVNTGSSKNVQISQRELGDVDVQTVLHNAQLQAYGYQQQATNEQAQSGLYAYEAPQAELAGDIGGVGQAFSAAGKFYAPRPAPTSSAVQTG